jgi:hypothetical protein
MDPSLRLAEGTSRGSPADLPVGFPTRQEDWLYEHPPIAGTKLRRGDRSHRPGVVSSAWRAALRLAIVNGQFAAARRT